MTIDSVSGSSSSAATLNQLIGLCDEISALVRTGLPLEEALLHKSREEQNRLGSHLKQLAEKLGTGKSLAEAIHSDPVFPPVYAAVVEAGLRSGNLAGALDSIAHNARKLRDARLFLLRTTLYPMILFTSLWFVFAGMFLFVGPRFATMFEAYHATTLLFSCMKSSAEHLQLSLMVVFAVPVLLWGLFFYWTICSAKGILIQSTGIMSMISWIPWIGSASLQLQKMAFARIFAMLVQASVPLDQAILLATQATSDQYWKRENQESLQKRIVDKKVDVYPRSVISPLITWALGIPDQKLLVEGLEQYASMSETRANSLIMQCEMILPGILTIGFAVLIAACYVLTVIWPYTQLLNILSGYRG